MSGGIFVSLMAILGALFSLLTWVGWRYFLAPVPVVELPVIAVIHRRSRIRAIWEERARLTGFSRTFVRFVTVAIVVGTLVVGGVFSLSQHIAPEPLAVQELERQSHIQGALNPEVLVPPPALPPSMFIGSERLALETADRDWNKLNPRFTQPILHVLANLEERGYTFVLLEGYRSPERQEKLADLDSHVTSARAFQSKHQFGLAVDLAPVRDGKLVISERDPWAAQAYTALGEEAEKAGLIWGGRWWFKDFGHVEVAQSIASSARSGQSSGNPGSGQNSNLRAE